MKTLNPNDLGKTFLVEECSKIRIEYFLRQYRDKLKERVLSSELEAQGWSIELTTSQTHYNGVRLWFKCPLCALRVGVLFRHPLNNTIGCRKCLKLEYRKRRYKGMIESKTLST